MTTIPQKLLLLFVTLKTKAHTPRLETFCLYLIFCCNDGVRETSTIGLALAYCATQDF